jgi:hypothetical protein
VLVVHAISAGPRPPAAPLAYALGPAFTRLRRTPLLSGSASTRPVHAAAQRLGVHETRARRRHRPRDPCTPPPLSGPARPQNSAAPALGPAFTRLRRTPPLSGSASTRPVHVLRKAPARPAPRSCWAAPARRAGETSVTAVWATGLPAPLQRQPPSQRQRPLRPRPPLPSPRPSHLYLEARPVSGRRRRTCRAGRRSRRCIW